ASDRWRATYPGGVAFSPSFRRRCSHLLSVKPRQVCARKYLVAHCDGGHGKETWSLRNCRGGIVGNHANGKSRHRYRDCDGDECEVARPTVARGLGGSSPLGPSAQCTTLSAAARYFGWHSDW